MLGYMMVLSLVFKGISILSSFLKTVWRFLKKLGIISSHLPGQGNGNPLQCSCLETLRDGGAWWAAIYGVAQSWTRLKRLRSSSSSSSILSSIVAVPVYIPTNSARAFLFSTSSPAFIVCRLFDDGHSDPCEVISNCSFGLHFSDNE